MGLFASADVQLLSEKWRRTVVLVALIVCIAALGITGIIIFKQQEILAATTAMLVILGRRALGLKGKDEKQLAEQNKRLESTP
jgi:TRAP-type C4-dicarboxylate transport system permease small subunit